MTEEHVMRYQFPLTLAWASTHWKAQGMTLRRVRITLGKRVAQSPGIGYVCLTRVRHPRDIVFEIDFPEYETFQSAKHKEAFRERCRFELRLRARASRTILKYAAGDGVPRVVCEADEWTEGDARIAVALLRQLKAKGDMKRAALRQSGRPVDKNAWIWGEKDPDFERELQEAVDALVTDERVCRLDCERVASRLQGVVTLVGGEEVALHMPAVREALGCLIPAELHPRLDNRAPKKNPGAAAETGSIQIQCGGWRVNVCEEQTLNERGPLVKGLLEFFLGVLRHVCARLKLSVFLGSIGLGSKLGDDESVEVFCRTLETWKSWTMAERNVVRAAEVCMLPVCVDDWDWSLGVVQAGCEGEALGETSEWRVGFLDRLKRQRLGDRVIPKVDALMGGLRSRVAVGGASESVLLPCGRCGDKRLSSVLVLGHILYLLADVAKEETTLDRESPGFVGDVQDALCCAF